MNTLTLTNPQKEALKKLSTTIWRSSYELKIGLGTLQALVNKGIVESKNKLGYFSMPFTCIEFRKLEKESKSESRVLKRRKSFPGGDKLKHPITRIIRRRKKRK